jgi:hypothetical protein
MEPMMTTTGWDFGLTALWGLHILSVVSFFTGVLFLIVLAIKTFTPAQLKSWAIWLMVVGTIVYLFTIAITGRPWIGLHYRDANMGGMHMQQMGKMMEMMMKHNGGANGEDQEEHGDMMQMMRMMMDSPQGGMMNDNIDAAVSDALDGFQDEHHESSFSSR